MRDLQSFFNSCNFSGYTKATELNSIVVAQFIMKQVSGLGLDLGNYVSQCYDGAFVISGNNTSVQTLIRVKSHQAIYVQCGTYSRCC